MCVSFATLQPCLLNNCYNNGSQFWDAVINSDPERTFSPSHIWAVHVPCQLLLNPAACGPSPYGTRKLCHHLDGRRMMGKSTGQGEYPRPRSLLYVLWEEVYNIQIDFQQQDHIWDTRYKSRQVEKAGRPTDLNIWPQENIYSFPYLSEGFAR